MSSTTRMFTIFQRSAEIKDRKVSIGETFGVIRLFISLATLIILAVIELIKWARKREY